MHKCKIEINIESYGDTTVKEGIVGTIKKEYIYHRQSGKVHEDIIVF